MEMRYLTNFFSSPHQYVILLFSLLAFSPTQAMVTYALPLQGDEHMIGNLLEWKTSLETRSKTFMVEKSLDGISYENIGLVEAAGESLDERGYRFLDINATSDKAFYRLKQVDTDGASSMSQIALVNRIIPNQFMVINMSNTATNTNFTCAIDAMVESSLTYELLNRDQEIMKSGSLDMWAGLNELVIDLSDEAEGFYALRLTVDKEVEMLTIQKVLDAAQVKENVAFKIEE